MHVQHFQWLLLHLAENIYQTIYQFNLAFPMSTDDFVDVVNYLIASCCL
jgi:hypothetical protein